MEVPLMVWYMPSPLIISCERAAVMSTPGAEMSGLIAPDTASGPVLENHASSSCLSIITGCDSHTTIYGALGLFSTGVGNNSMAGLGFRHGMGWFRVPETILVVFHGKAGEAVTARDVSQFLVGHLGEDGAVYKAVEYAGPYIESLSVDDRQHLT
jgi:homoaconitase/3-isopropylmalate dehydratase large subunit